MLLKLFGVDFKKAVNLIVVHLLVSIGCLYAFLQHMQLNVVL